MRLVLLSDLHIGMHRTALVGPLLDAIAGARADHMLVAGDLVQRARPALFAQARALLDRTGLPWLGVPGNHDIPLMNLPARLLHPLRAYDAAIPGGRQPVLDLPGLRVIGVNSTSPLRWRGGRVDDAQIARVRELAQGRAAMLIQHHPLGHLPGETKPLMHDAGPTLAAYEAAGVELVLSGHLHAFNLGTAPSGMIRIHAGAALCDRPEDPPCEFALLDVAPDGFRLTRMRARDGGFQPDPAIALPRRQPRP